MASIFLMFVHYKLTHESSGIIVKNMNGINLWYKVDKDEITINYQNGDFVTE
jgi:hypothetical protein